MTNQLEALIAEMKAAAEGAKDAFSRYDAGEMLISEFCDAINKYKSYTIQPDNVLGLIAALEQSQQYARDRDAENQDLMLTVGRLRVEREQLEASKLAVKLPPKFNVSMGGDKLTRIAFRERNTTIDECAKAIRAAGGQVEGE